MRVNQNGKGWKKIWNVFKSADVFSSQYRLLYNDELLYASLSHATYTKQRIFDTIKNPDIFYNVYKRKMNLKELYNDTS